jgi:LL-diaminopimelate aminotransferase
MIQPSDRVKQLTSYAFAEVDKEVEKLKKAGIEPIDFGVGDPRDPTPGLIRNYTKRCIDKRKSTGYPSYIGQQEFREEVAAWTKKRFNVDLDPNKEICSSIGAKEAVFNFALAFINPGDYVLAPNPGYPPYERGTSFAGGKTHFMNLLEENNFLPKLEEVPNEIAKKAKILWLNYPNNPTTALATKEFYKEAIDFCNDNNIILASDEPYTENYYDEKPISALNIAKENVVVFQSLSKRSNMTGYRVGWVAGDENIITPYKKIKTNIDSGTATFIQDAAIAALSDEKHVESARYYYKLKRNLIVNALTEAGLPRCTPKATIYIWQRCPQGMSSVEFATKLLHKEVAVVTTPGSWISHEVNGVNPGEGYVRFALVPSLNECKLAAEKIRQLKF